MQFIKNLFGLLVVYIILLSIYLGLTFYLRPDITINTFINNPYYWIGPAILLYIVLNFKRLFYGIINKIIILFVLFFGLNHFFPQFGNSLKQYIGSAIPNSDSVKKQANEILTPKNGMEPKYQFDINTKPTNKKEKTGEVKPKKENSPIENNDVEPYKNKSESTIIDDIEKLPSKALESLPKEATDKLKEAGVDIENPVNTLENIQNKKKEMKDSFFK